MQPEANTVPSPRPADAKSARTPSCTSSFHSRRDSLPISPYHLTSPRAVPVPVPSRNGCSSMSSNESQRREGSASLGLTGSPGQSWRSKVDKEMTTAWLYTAAEEVLDKDADGGVVRLIKGDMGMEEAVDILLRETCPCLLVEKGPEIYGFFNYTDLNSFLLMVLQAASTKRFPRADSSGSLSDCAIEDEEPIVSSLRRGERVTVGELCDVSQKNPYHSVPASTPIRSVLPIFASGIHRVALISDGRPRVLTSAMLLEHLVSLPEEEIPSTLGREVGSSGLPLHPLVSLAGTASVLDAMQVMSTEGLSALGVLAGTGRVRRESLGSERSSSSGSAIASPMPVSPQTDAVDGDLVSIITAKECTSLVVPSEGKQVLGMGLEQMVKQLQVVEQGGRDRGEERVPVNMVSSSTTLLHASHLILATSSSRVFLRTQEFSPPLSPVPSLSMSPSPPVSPSIVSVALYDRRNLPRPPATQISPHHVISILDILSCLAKASTGELAPLELRKEDWDLDPAGMGKRRRASSFAEEDGGFGKWRWAGRMGK